nr:hypothetical protein [Streptomyces apricus]
MLHRLDDAGLIDVTRVVLDTAHVRLAREHGLVCFDPQAERLRP